MHYIVTLKNGMWAQEFRFYTWKKAHKFVQQALIHSMDEEIEIKIEIEGSNLAQLTTLNNNTTMITENERENND